MQGEIPGIKCSECGWKMNQKWTFQLQSSFRKVVFGANEKRSVAQSNCSTFCLVLCGFRTEKELGFSFKIVCLLVGQMSLN